jgi:DNA-binding MarR family transcriptional regulator
MGIEQAIKQAKFENEYEKAAVNILFTGSWLSNMNSTRLKKHGITPEQYNVLRILRGSHPKSMMLAEVTARMIDKSSNCTRLVEKLRQKELLKREICENSRRQVDITILDSGLAVLRKIDAEAQQWLDTLKNITNSEAQELNRILDKLRG